MANLVDSIIYHCPNCGGSMIIQIWSCGCKKVLNGEGHKDICPDVLYGKYNFNFLNVLCGIEGHPKYH